MLKFIQTYKQRQKLKHLKAEYDIVCDDLVCYRRALKKSIHSKDDRLSSALRDSIRSLLADESRLKNHITVLHAFLKKSKLNNNVLSTGG